MGKRHDSRLTTIVLAIMVVVSGLAVPMSAPPAPLGPHTERTALAEAKRTGRPVEVSMMGTETVRVLANPSGTVTAESHHRPIRVRRGDGWVPVDPTLVFRPDGAVAPRAAVADLAFSPGGATAPLARIGHGGHGMALSWPAPLPVPVLDKDTATYRDVLPEVDLVVRATSLGFSEVLVVKTPQAARNPALAQVQFGLGTNGLTVRAENDGSLAAVDAQGRPVVTSPRAYMWDSTANAPGHDRLDGPAGHDQVRQMAVNVTADSLRLTPDTGLLAGPDTRFPVYIDPYFSVTKLHWARVSESMPDKAFYDQKILARVGRDMESDLYRRYRSYFEMNTEPMGGKNIRKATFRAFIWWRQGCYSEPVQLWHVGTIGPGTTWRNPPAHVKKVAEVTIGATTSCPQGNMDMDVTSLVREAAAARWAHVTIGLFAPEDGRSWGAKAFLSEPVPEHHMTGPVFEVEYNTVPDVPTGLTVEGRECSGTPAYVRTTTPQLAARFSDADSAVGQEVRGTFQWWDSSGGLVGSSNSIYRVPGTISVPVPGGQLADGSTYSWEVRGEDSIDFSAYTSRCQFTVDTVAPGKAPDVSSVTYPENGFGGQVDQPGRFTFTANGVPDVAAFLYGLNTDPSVRVEPATLGGSATVDITPVRESRNQLAVQSVDRAGNRGPIRRYDFLVNSLPDPCGYWPFSDGGGDFALDESWHGNDATTTGNVTWTGERNGAVRFAADGSFGTAGPVVDTQDSFTAMAWVRLDRTDGRFSAVSQDGMRRSGFDLRYEQGRWMFAMAASDTDDASSAAATTDTMAQPGVWTHLTGVYDGASGQLRIYVNGRLAGTTAHRGTWSASGGSQIGRGMANGTASQHWPGDLDDVRIYSRTTTIREIRELMDCDCFRPGGRWSLDEATGRLATDSAGGSHTMALADGATFAQGRDGNGVRLDGVKGHAYSAGPVVRTDNSFSVAAWVRLDRGGDYVTAVSQDGPVSSAFRLTYSHYPRGWEFVTYGGADGAAGVAHSGPVAQIEAWTHLTGVYDAEARQLRLYVNGSPAAAVPFQVARNVEGALLVGRARYDGVPGGFWPGVVDDVQVLDRAVPESEIRRLMNGPSFGPGATWKFDEESGPHAADATNNGHTLELWPGASRTTGRTGNGLRLDGNGGHAFASQPVARTDTGFTAAAWVRLDDYAGDNSRVAVSQDGEYNSGFQLRFSKDKTRWTFLMPKIDARITDHVSQVARLDSTVTARTGVWTHLAGVYDAAAATMRLYVDGQLAGTLAHRSTWQARRALMVGRGKWDTWSSDFWPGAVDEVRILDHAASAEEIQALSGIPSLPSGPVPGGIVIRSAQSNLCLSERAGADDGYIHQVDCGIQYPPMTLDVAGDDTYRIAPQHPVHGPGCLGIVGGSTVAGQPVYSDFCAAGRGQLFRLEPVLTPVRGFRIRPVHSELCLGSPANSAQIHQLTCDPASAGQVFLFDPRQTPPVPDQPVPGPYQIRAVHSDLCLTERLRVEEGRIVQGLCANQTPPLALEKVADGQYRITAQHPVRGPGCLGIVGGGAGIGANAYLDACGDGKGQLFRLVPVNVPARGFRIRPVHSELCLGIPSNSTLEWAPVQQLACDAAAAGQIFRFGA
ncbi:LamG-like jellyroll fold domain-containing protein [Kibdelosporangium persicum]|uniref:LamG-like jellyroll fold domain-containing protein n=1 Tax=Kibdelosporangium persicum TaxID=2698649 RepID=A0ABX2FF53_9PSEU|nr:LamG-like jellyroll fold domain-containing protein [Kibdelosporangium persicum]NRN69451.1 hypothetical protein [Kibdelosporangium persicum]